MHSLTPVGSRTGARLFANMSLVRSTAEQPSGSPRSRSEPQWKRHGGRRGQPFNDNE